MFTLLCVLMYWFDQVDTIAWPTIWDWMSVGLVGDGILLVLVLLGAVGIYIWYRVQKAKGVDIFAEKE